MRELLLLIAISHNKIILSRRYFIAGKTRNATLIFKKTT